MADQCSFQQLAAVELLTGHNSRLVVSAVARVVAAVALCSVMAATCIQVRQTVAKCKCQRLHRVLITTRIVR